MNKLSSRALAVALAVVTLVPLTGCKKGPALEELKKVEDACKAKDKDKALDIALKAAEGNSSFKKAFDGVFQGVDDKKKANICGEVNLSEMKMRIENGPAI